MEKNKYYKIIFFNMTLLVFCFIDRSLQHTLTKRGSNKGGITAEEFSVSKRIILRQTSVADDKCREYTQLVDYQNRGVEIPKGSSTKFQFPSGNSKFNFGNCEMDLVTASQNNDLENEKNSYQPVEDVDSVYDETTINSKHYPHMALLGYGKTPDDSKWACEGSLISEKWILTAAQCEKYDILGYANWARLGEQPKDYRIAYRAIHPCYRPPSYYNDIALFRLETEVEFSNFIRPVCLNTDPIFEPRAQEIIGRGRPSIYEPNSENLQLVSIPMNTISSYECNDSYISDIGKAIKFGILADRMICVVPTEDIKDNCADEVGNALQIKLDKSQAVYTLFGIQSFGKLCENDNKLPIVYTKVSKYISWIESIVWRYY